MATSEVGTLAIVPVTTAQISKINSFNGHETTLTKSTTGMLVWDAAGLTGTQVLTQEYSKNGTIKITGALAGAVTMEIDNDIKQNYWFLDSSTAYAVSVQPVGGGALVVLPKNRWIQLRATTTVLNNSLSGWQDSSMAGALSFAAAYQVDAARPLKVRKNGQQASAVGGMVHLEGAVEETTTNPVVGDTIVTLPQYYRPTHPIGRIICANPGTTLANHVSVEIQTSGAIIIRNLHGWGGSRINVPIDLSGITFFSGN